MHSHQATVRSTEILSATNTVTACFRTTAGQLIEAARGNCKVNCKAPADLQSSRDKNTSTNITI